MKLPRSHDIVKKLSIPNNHLGFDELVFRLKDSISKIFIESTEELQQHFLWYFYLTVACLVTDLLQLFIQLVRFGRDGDEYSDMTLLLCCFIFLSLDLFYGVWAKQVQSKFPDEISEPVSKALFGYATEMKNYLAQNMKEVREQGIRNSIRTQMAGMWHGGQQDP